MSKLTAMLKWAMRITAVSGALLAIAVGTAAWMHRTEGRQWLIAIPIPAVCSIAVISPQYVSVEWWLLRDWDERLDWFDGRYGAVSNSCKNSQTLRSFQDDLRYASVGVEWHGFGIVRGQFVQPIMPSYTAVLCPTWSLIGFLLLPMSLWSGIAWRQRRRVKAGHCVCCGYDLRASPKRCPECGRNVTGAG